jgi:hypothetical protein
MARQLPAIRLVEAVDPSAYVSMPPEARRLIDTIFGKVRFMNTAASGSFTTAGRLESVRADLPALKALIADLERALKC